MDGASKLVTRPTTKTLLAASASGDGTSKLMVHVSATIILSEVPVN